MQIQELVGQIPSFDKAAPKTQIKYLAWWLHTYRGKDLFTTGDVRDCYHKLHIKEPPALATYLTRLCEARDLLKEKDRYKLTRQVRVDLDGKHGVSHHSITVSKLLTDLVGKVSNLAEQNFLAEAIKCYRVEAYRACVIMVWNVAYNHLLNWILNDQTRLAKFNSKIVKRNAKKAGLTIYKYDDFEELKEREVIDICNLAILYNGGVNKILLSKLDRRNMAAHPSSLIIVQPQADDAITDLVNNVILGLG